MFVSVLTMTHKYDNRGRRQNRVPCAGRVPLDNTRQTIENAYIHVLDTYLYFFPYGIIFKRETYNRHAPSICIETYSEIPESTKTLLSDLIISADRSKTNVQSESIIPPYKFVVQGLHNRGLIHFLAYKYKT